MVTQTLRLAALLLLAALVCEAGLSRSLAQAKKPKKSEDVVKVTVTADKPSADGTQAITITVAIDKDWHIYANQVGNKDYADAATTLVGLGTNKPELVQVDYPPGKLVKDKDGDYKTYVDTVVIKAQIRRNPGGQGPVELGLKINACCDRVGMMVCLKESTVKLTVP